MAIPFKAVAAYQKLAKTVPEKPATSRLFNFRLPARLLPRHTLANARSPFPPLGHMAAGQRLLVRKPSRDLEIQISHLSYACISQPGRWAELTGLFVVYVTRKRFHALHSKGHLVK